MTAEGSQPPRSDAAAELQQNHLATKVPEDRWQPASKHTFMTQHGVARLVGSAGSDHSLLLREARGSEEQAANHRPLDNCLDTAQWSIGHLVKIIFIAEPLSNAFTRSLVPRLKCSDLRTVTIVGFHL